MSAVKRAGIVIGVVPAKLVAERVGPRTAPIVPAQQGSQAIPITNALLRRQLLERYQVRRLLDRCQLLAQLAFLVRRLLLVHWGLVWTLQRVQSAMLAARQQTLESMLPRPLRTPLEVQLTRLSTPGARQHTPVLIPPPPPRGSLQMPSEVQSTRPWMPAARQLTPAPTPLPQPQQRLQTPPEMPWAMQSMPAARQSMLVARQHMTVPMPPPPPHQRQLMPAARQ
mmetsp:Transcript_75518/g.233625  ORF Transcript_75518/g.233625 Transcript_75518/m.233625 type:complete len:225 (+) Transcript_75518:1120-1794(+)